MEEIKMRLKDISLKLKELSLNEYIVIALISSVFISVYLQAALILLLPIFYIATKQTRKALPREKHEYALLAFSVLSMLTTFIRAEDATVREQVIKANWLKLLSIGIIILVFNIIFFSNIMTKRAFHLGMVLSAVLSITSFIIAVIQKFLGIHPDPITRPGRVASVYFNENYYSTVIEFIVIIALYLLFKSTNKKAKVFYGFVVTINIIGLYLSQCRTAYMAVTISIVTFFLIHLSKKQLCGIIFCILIIALLMTLCSKVINIEVLERFNLNRLISDFGFRSGIWKTALNSVKDYPFFGHGYYSYGAVMNNSTAMAQYTAIHAHNLIIEILMDFGIVGTALLLAYCIISVKKCLELSIASKEKTSLALIISTVLSIVVHGIFDITVIFPQTGFFVVFLLGIPQMFDEKVVNQ